VDDDLRKVGERKRQFFEREDPPELYMEAAFAGLSTLARSLHGIIRQRDVAVRKRNEDLDSHSVTEVTEKYILEDLERFYQVVQIFSNMAEGLSDTSKRMEVDDEFIIKDDEEDGPFRYFKGRLFSPTPTGPEFAQVRPMVLPQSYALSSKIIPKKRPHTPDSPSGSNNYSPKNITSTGAAGNSRRGKRDSKTPKPKKVRSSKGTRE